MIAQINYFSFFIRKSSIPLPKMNFENKYIFIYLFVVLFFISMGSEATINMQYGQNSMYNEIEHTDSHTDFNEEHKIPIKVCQDLPKFVFGEYDNLLKSFINLSEYLSHQFVLSYPTPPPEYNIL